MDLRQIALISFVFLSACVGPSVMTSRNVTVPVMLGPVKKIGQTKSDRGARQRYFEIETETSIFASTREEGNYRITEATAKQEGHNKYDANILQAMGSCSKCQVHLDEIYFGSWHMFLITGLLEKAYVGVQGGVYEAAK